VTNLMRAAKPSFNRRALATQAMQAAIATRAKAKLDQHGPICIYGLCETLGVTVRFNNINMEGMYQRGTPPPIHLSPRRPLQRRAYNCAHELGHHVFGHGSSIDELREDAKDHPWEDPEEFLADTFAGFALMPIIGLRRAFAARGWSPETATATQMFTIACARSLCGPRPIIAIWRMIRMSKSKASLAPEPVMIIDTDLSRAGRACCSGFSTAQAPKSRRWS
jgi:uncharacterized protein DUF955